MASQTRTYARKKLLGQVYTPFHIVDKILGHCGFYEADLSEKRMLDPACGDGRFLELINAFGLATLKILEAIVATLDRLMTTIEMCVDGIRLDGTRLWRTWPKHSCGDGGAVCMISAFFRLRHGSAIAARPAG